MPEPVSEPKDMGKQTMDKTWALGKIKGALERDLQNGWGKKWSLVKTNRRTVVKIKINLLTIKPWSLKKLLNIKCWKRSDVIQWCNFKDSTGHNVIIFGSFQLERLMFRLFAENETFMSLVFFPCKYTYFFPLGLTTAFVQFLNYLVSLFLNCSIFGGSDLFPLKRNKKRATKRLL